MAQKVIRSDGEVASSVSTYCPKCGFHLVTPSFSKDKSGQVKGVIPEPTFDETGWHYCQVLTCNRAACGHKWTEKICAQQNGSVLQ